MVFMEKVLVTDPGFIAHYVNQDGDVFPSNVMEMLHLETPWRQEYFTFYGKTIPQPRLVCLYGSEDYTYSGLKVPAQPTPPMIQDLQQIVEETVGSKFNSVLLNYYRDGQDSIGYHADDEPELGVNPTIAGLSFGSIRSLCFRHNELAKRNFVVDQNHGDIVVMSGSTQTYWKHAILKTKRVVGPRISLTFRMIGTK